MKTEKLERITDLLAPIPKHRRFLILEKLDLTFGDVLSTCEEFGNSFRQQVEGKNCAIISEDRESLALFLPAVDRIAKSIFLQPDNCNNYEKEFYELADIHTLIRLRNCKVLTVTQINPQNSFKKSLEGRYILATSGTTGTPKLARYSLESLIATSQKNIIKGENFSWGLAYDINRFAGLQVYLQTIVSGSQIAVAPESKSIDNIVNFYVKKSVNCVSATPSFWRKVLMSPNHSKLSLKQITLGGEISDDTILAALRKNYATANIVHIYASTEAGVGFVVKDEKEGFPNTYLDSHAFKNCELKIKKNLLWIRNKNGCKNLIKGELETDSNGFINTGDLVEIRNDRVLFLGRDSGAINVGGNKVMPEKVEAALESIPYVEMARVFAKSSPVLGSLVSAELVIEDAERILSMKELKQNVLDHCRERLEKYELPALIKKVDSIEVNSTGKKVRNVQ